MPEHDVPRIDCLAVKIDENGAPRTCGCAESGAGDRRLKRVSVLATDEEREDERR